MKITPRALVVAAFGVGPMLLLASCGGTTATGARATIANIQPTSFVEIAPATTTSTSTLPSEASLQAGTRSPVEQTYTIQSGDSLGKIASLFDITLDQLVNYNQFPNGANQLILPGEQVKIPPDALVPGSASTSGNSSNSSGSATGNEPAGTEAPAATSPDEGCTHTIVAGENPSSVARKYDITVDQLNAANPGGVMTTFLVGATLQIPPGASC